MALREAVEAAVNTVTEAQEAKEPVTPAEKVEPQVEAKEVSVTTEPVEKSSRTEGRPRDDKGRLLPGPAAKVDAPKPELKVEAAPVAAPPKPKTPPPSSWKKETWEHWEKADPNLQAYIAQRESEFAKGVSTYKQDFDRVKPLADVVSQYEPFLKQHNMAPHQAVDALFKNDQTLRFGTQQQKLQTFAKLATDYQIPLHEMLVQGEDGKVYLNQQYFQPQQQQAPQGLSQADVERMFAERMARFQVDTAIQQFQAAKDKDGNPLYPHFDTVKQTMDGILRSGLAQDLPSAYAKSLRMHDDIWEAEQQAKQAAAHKATQETQARQVAKAKAAAVSPKTDTPSGDTPKATKGIRSAVEAAIDARTASGRV